MKFKQPYTQYEGKWIIWKTAMPYKAIQPKYFLLKFLNVRDRVNFYGVLIDNEVAYKRARTLSFPKVENLDFAIFEPKQDDYKRAIKNIWIKGT